MRITNNFYYVSLSLLFVANVEAAIIPNLFPTGVDNSGVVLGDGANDSHYALLTPSGSAVTIFQSSIPGSWVSNNSTSRWVWETSSGQPTNVTRTFRTTFDLTGLDPATAQITGTWSTDNTGLDILINGNSTGNTSSGFGSFTNFLVNSNFVVGTNVLDFVVNDFGVISGFRVGSIAGTAEIIPEPSSVTLVIVCVLLLSRRVKLSHI